MIYDRNGAPEPSAARSKLTFPKLIDDPVCHAAAILKGPFLNFYWKNKRGENAAQCSDSLDSAINHVHHDRYVCTN